MNNFKNLVILFLSLIVLVQSVFLVYFLSQKTAASKIQKSHEAPVAIKDVIEEKETPVEPQQPQPVKPKPANLGTIAIVIDDWGYNLKNKYFITDNDFHVTLSVLPFRAYSAKVAEMAQSSGKDVIIHMPMEPHNKESYGLEENTILTDMDKRTVIGLLDKAFDAVPYAIGISNHMGSKATENLRLMRMVIEYLKKKNMLFLDSLVTSESVCGSLAKRFGLEFAQRDVFIDNESDPEYIKGQMEELAKVARKKGVAVGIGHDRPETIAVLSYMIPELERQGYRFVKLSEIISTE